VIAFKELGLCETMLGKEHPSTLTSINNLAAVLRYQGKYEHVVEMYRQELRLCKTVLGQDHPSTLTSTSKRWQKRLEMLELKHPKTTIISLPILFSKTQRAAHSGAT
jgi:hypothetical protein